MARIPLDIHKSMIKITSHNIESSFAINPDPSINYEEVAEHYKLFPERWNAAFKFLSENNLNMLPCGRIYVNEDVYVTVSIYTTKKLENAYYESHKKYIDLQYLVSGEEYIGLTKKDFNSIRTPYNEEKDITLYDYNGGKLLLATPAVYFIFFPEDLHRPCINVNKNSIVKKIVVKIKL